VLPGGSWSNLTNERAPGRVMCNNCKYKSKWHAFNRGSPRPRKPREKTRRKGTLMHNAIPIWVQKGRSVLDLWMYFQPGCLCGKTLDPSSAARPVKLDYFHTFVRAQCARILMLRPHQSLTITWFLDILSQNQSVYSIYLCTSVLYNIVSNLPNRTHIAWLTII
jgi:hypothetical protein